MGNKAVAKLAMFQCVHNEYKKTRKKKSTLKKWGPNGTFDIIA